ncbi:tryptophan-rich sensory protein [Candidatus Bathyarchaeota archaeon A05DMB-2]|nr:tryptophan-rich sensory protein [Candidatus Bathyarchaeota archaeon A05DMB-2]
MKKADTVTYLRWGNIAGFIAVIVVNSLAGSTTMLNGKNTAEISDAYPTLITPAGYVFSIWGLIYALLAAFVIFQALPGQKQKPFQKQIGALFILSSVFNVVWLFLWQYEYVTVSVSLMFALLATLIAIYLRLNINRSSVPARERLAVHLPFSVYLGWITIAAIANVAAALVAVNWDGFGLSAETWAVAIIIIASIITLVVTLTRRDVAYSLVVIWALAGIAVKQSASHNIVTTAEAGIAVIAVALAATIVAVRLRRRKT